MMQNEINRGNGMPVVALALTGIGVFVAGLSAGITLTLLFAPLSGSDTRRLIGRTVTDSENWVKDKAHVAEEYLHAQGERIRDRAKEVADVTARK